MEGVILICRIAGGSTFSVYQTEYAGRADHTTAQWHVGDVAFMRDVGKAAWSTDSEINILCLDDGFPGERVG